MLDVRRGDFACKLGSDELLVAFLSVVFYNRCLTCPKLLLFSFYGLTISANSPAVYTLTLCSKKVAPNLLQ